MPNASLGENIIVHHLQSRNDNTTTTAIRIHSFLKLTDYTPEGPWAIIVHHCPELFSKDTGGFLGVTTMFSCCLLMIDKNQLE